MSFPFLLALASIFFLGWSVWLAISYPDEGFQISSDNWVVTNVDKSGPAYGNIRNGDFILAVNSVPVSQALPFYSNLQPGDVVEYTIQRKQQIIHVSSSLTVPTTVEISLRLIPIIVALTFWLVGVSVMTFKSPERATDLFFVFCQVAAIALTAGTVSTMSSAWVSSLFNIMTWLLGPLMVHFHFWFPRQQPLRQRRYLIGGLYTLAGLGSLPYVLWDRKYLAAVEWAPTLRLTAWLFLLFNLFIVVLILSHTYRHAANAMTKGKIRIVLLGGFVGLLPLATLTILPTALFGQAIIPNEFAFLLLGVIPLTYGYAIVRHRLIEIERHVNRGATQVLVYSLIGAIYLLLSAGLTRLLPEGALDQLLTNTLVVLLLASIFHPLKTRVQIFVDRAFYGGWYDYRSAITRITQGLEQLTELRVLAKALCERTQNTLLLENIYLFLTGPRGDLSIYETFGRTEIVYQQAASFPILPPDSPLMTFLQGVGGPIDTPSLKEALASEELTPEDLVLLDCEQIRLWVPILGREKITGVLALGPKVGGDVFTVDDLYILGVVSRQVGPLIENIHLLTRLRQYARDLEKRVEERTAELYDAKERVEAILASVGDGVVVTNLEGKIIAVNQAFEQQSTYGGSEITGRDFFTLLREHNPADKLEDMQLTLRSGEVWIGELKARRQDGSDCDIHLTMAPVRDQHGRMVGFVGSQRDITQQRELDRLKDQFISDVSHELRTPVTNLSLYLGLLERSQADKRAEYISIIRKEIKRLTVLLEDILDLSRLERKKSEQVSLALIDLNQVTEQVVTSHRLLANTSGLELVFEPMEDLPPVYGDENLLARVVTNLVSNAIRYTPAGKIWVRTFHENGRVCLQVQDTGMGIDEEDMPHIFERFYRGRRVSQSKIPGTGLGLAIVKEIVDIHEGDVDVQSKPGRGATINIWLPLKEVVAWPEKLS